jgi:hypothetical protein
MVLDLNIATRLIFYLRNRCRAIVKAASCRLTIAANRVRAKVRLCGICGGQIGTGGCFIRVFWFSLPICIQPTASYLLIALSSMLYNADAGSVIK